ncbi:hypothetical protein CMUS01_09553 [Colletotrichum musicola]|uniref:Uncharacterized protein n=1 Tax=Colletotrichum musicola TaxID=2175873 RepID=A0A8H6NB85_9PEZI|nr:hypothetical protein CMUS01_09553 [Colletotrichum musicola]
MQRPNLALLTPLSEPVTSRRFMVDLEMTARNTCLDAADYNPDLASPEQPLRLLRNHVFDRINRLHTLRFRLLNNFDFDKIPRNLDYTYRLLKAVFQSPQPVSNAALIASACCTGMFQPSRDSFLAACSLCAEETVQSNSTTPEPDDDRPDDEPGYPTSPPTQDWHFACSSAFAHTAVDDDAAAAGASQAHDTASAFLLDWAVSRSAQRLESLNNAPLDVDDTPMFPDNLHPFFDADDVVFTNLPAEADLVHLLTERLAPSAPAHGREPRPLPRWLSRALFRSPDLPQRLGSGATVAAGIETLMAYRNNSVIPVLGLVARVAAGMSSACSAAGDILETLDGISRGHPIEQETASIRAPEPNATARTAPTRTHVTHYMYTPDPTGERESLSREAERAWAQFAAINSELHQGANAASSGKPTPRTQTTAIVPRNAEESAVLEALFDRNFVSVDGIADLVDIFRPVPISVGNEEISQPRLGKSK